MNFLYVALLIGVVASATVPAPLIPVLDSEVLLNKEILTNVVKMAESGSTISKSLTSLLTTVLKQQIITFQSSVKDVSTMLGILTPMSGIVNADLLKPLEFITKTFENLSEATRKFSENVNVVGTTFNNAMIESIKTFPTTVSTQLGQVVSLITSATSALETQATAPYISSLNKIMTLISKSLIDAFVPGTSNSVIAVLPKEMLKSLNDFFRIAITLVQLFSKNLSLLTRNLVTPIDRITGLASKSDATFLSVSTGALTELQAAAATVVNQLNTAITETTNIANSAITTLSNQMTNFPAIALSSISAAINQIPNAFLIALDVMNANVNDLVASVNSQAVNITPTALKELNAAVIPLTLAITAAANTTAKGVACSKTAQASYNSKVTLWNADLAKCNATGSPNGIALKLAATTLSTKLLELTAKFQTFINNIVDQKFADVKPSLDAVFTLGPTIWFSTMDAVSEFQAQLKMTTATSLKTIQSCVDGVVVTNKAALLTIGDALQKCLL